MPLFLTSDSDQRALEIQRYNQILTYCAVNIFYIVRTNTAHNEGAGIDP